MSVAKFVMIASLVAVIAAPAFAKPSTSSSLKQQIQATYAKMDQAFANKNLDGFTAFYDPNYVGVDEDNKPEYLTQVRQSTQFMFGEDRFMHAATTVQSVKQWNKGVLILAQTLMKWDTDGGTLHMKILESDEDYWVKSGGAWKLKQEKELSEFTWHNGKPYNG